MVAFEAVQFALEARRNPWCWSNLTNMTMRNMRMFVKLHEEPMQSILTPVTAELSNRVVVLLSDEMLKALDDWRWANRVSSRGEAIRVMVADALERQPPKPKEKPSK